MVAERGPLRRGGAAERVSFRACAKAKDAQLATTRARCARYASCKLQFLSEKSGVGFIFGVVAEWKYGVSEFFGGIAEWMYAFSEFLVAA